MCLQKINQLRCKEWKIKKEIILEPFFKEHMQVNEIAEKIRTSVYITKIIKQIQDIWKKNLSRKEISKRNRKITQNNSIKNKREQKKIYDQYSSVQAQHNQAVMELSKRGHMNNQIFRK